MVGVIGKVTEPHLHGVPNYLNGMSKSFTSKYYNKGI